VSYCDRSLSGVMYRVFNPLLLACEHLKRSNLGPSLVRLCVFMIKVSKKLEQKMKYTQGDVSGPIFTKL